jgi:hypothetical protein
MADVLVTGRRTSQQRTTYWDNGTAATIETTTEVTETMAETLMETMMETTAETPAEMTTAADMTEESMTE